MVNREALVRAATSLLQNALDASQFAQEPKIKIDVEVLDGDVRLGVCIGGAGIDWS